MTKKILIALAIRTLTVIAVTLSIWGTLFLYDVFETYLGWKYAHVFGWVSGVTGGALVAVILVMIMTYVEKNS